MRNGLEDLARSLAKSTRLLFLFSCASPFLPLRKWIGSMRGGYRRSNIDRMFPSINSLGVLDTSFGGCVRGEVNERAKKYTRTQKRERERECVCRSTANPISGFGRLTDEPIEAAALVILLAIRNHPKPPETHPISDHLCTAAGSSFIGEVLPSCPYFGNALLPFFCCR